MFWSADRTHRRTAARRQLCAAAPRWALAPLLRPSWATAGAVLARQGKNETPYISVAQMDFVSPDTRRGLREGDALDAVIAEAGGSLSAARIVARRVAERRKRTERTTGRTLTGRSGLSTGRTTRTTTARTSRGMAGRDGWVPKMDKLTERSALSTAFGRSEADGLKAIESMVEQRRQLEVKLNEMATARTARTARQN